jgi:hypothetical protein
MRDGVPAGYSMSTTAPAASRGVPSVGSVCMRKPGAALTSTMPPPTSAIGCSTEGEMTSMPAMSRPDDPGDPLHQVDVGGWTESVTSREMPPVERFAVAFR